MDRGDCENASNTAIRGIFVFNFVIPRIFFTIILSHAASNPLAMLPEVGNRQDDVDAKLRR
jgi:hypothetical protein